MHIRKTILAAAFAVAGTFAFAEENVLWVDDDNYGKGGDGTEQNPYGTIQDAIDNAQDNWTIYVKPGTYDKGGATPAPADGEAVADGMARVLVKKPLKIIATGSAADTFIVGASDPDYLAAPNYGCGPKAVRCVRFEMAASKAGVVSVIKGFTIKDGRCTDQPKTAAEGGGFHGDWQSGQPAGVAYRGATYGNGYVSDCVITNCYGIRGGSIRYGKCVRTTIVDCVGLAGNGMGRDTSYVSCLFPKGTGGTLFTCRLVNCTFFNCTSSCIASGENGNSALYNVLFADIVENDPTTKALTNGVSRNCVMAARGYNADEKNCVYRQPYQLFAPIKGDCHVRAGSVAATIGSAAELDGRINAWFPDAPAEVEIRKGMDKVSFPATGSIPAGCYAETKTAAGGALYFNNGIVDCGGRQAATYGAQYAYSEKAYDALQVKPVAGKTFFRIGRYNNQGGTQYPEMDESFWAHYPPADMVVTNDIYYVQAELWVDAENGSDATGDGTELKPYKTLTNVVAKAKKDDRTLIHAAAGDYKDGVATDVYGRSRVSLYAKNIRLKGAGRGLSFISGEPDPDTDPTALDRRGPKAVRCVRLNNSDFYTCCVQGFTLRNGYVDTGTESAGTMTGGLVYDPVSSENHENQVVDCELDGGQAYRSGQMQGGTATRCVFRNWKLTTVGHAVRSLFLRNCLFCDIGESCSPIDDSPSYHITLARTTTGDLLSATGCPCDGDLLYAPNVSAGTKFGSTAAIGTYYWMGGTATGYTEAEARRANPEFVDIANGDYRLKTTSAIFANRFDVSPNYWKMPATDLNGVPFDFTTGKEVPGAISVPAVAMEIKQPAYGTFSNEGGTKVGDAVILTQGETATVTYTKGARRVESVLTNGVAMAGNSFSYTYDKLYNADGSVPRWTFTVAYGTNWYVNGSVAASGNGETPETAWKTINEAKDSGLTYEGDCIHVAPGTYVENGYTDSANGDSCVWVPRFRTLVADEGPAVTTIKGKKAATSTGKGAGAMRCVYLERGAVVKGFTLADGYVSGTDATEAVVNCGGGVLAATSFNTSPDECGMAYGCVITNCVAARGGAIKYGKAVNCKILYCNGTACSAASNYSVLIGCFIDGCKGPTGQWCRSGLRVIRCTFGPNNNDGSDPFESNSQVENCVLMRTASVSDASAKNCKNCFFVDNAAWTDARKAMTTGCTWFADYAAMGLDATGHATGKTADVVDAAGDPATPAYDNYLGGVDADGGQRVYNDGKADVGAYEYDWRGVYAADLGTMATVVKASPETKETDEGKVLVQDGTFAIRFKDQASDLAKFDVPFEVTGTGTLTVTSGTKVVGTYTAEQGAQTLRVKLREITDNTLAFNYAPGSDDDGGALFNGTITGANSGFMIIFR